jgi:tRNA pseudouridine55 synthase
MAIISWNKKYTETLAKTLERFRQKYPEYNNEKVTYAGRLDPMAEGLLMLLTGNDVHKKNDFLNLDKTYEVEFFFGAETDTYDVLGLINKTTHLSDNFDLELEKVLAKKIGKFKQAYPPYSSKPVMGKPLFVWSRENKLNEIEIPEREVNIFDISYLDKKEIDNLEFKQALIDSINAVDGDFRQDQIIKKWQHYFETAQTSQSFIIYSMRVQASSGTYMRSLVVDIGKRLGISACTLKIKRTEVGKFKLNI